MKTKSIFTILALSLSLTTFAQTSNLPKFSKIKVFGKIEVNIQKGNDYSISFKSDVKDSKSVSFDMLGDELHIKTKSPIPMQTNAVVQVLCPEVEVIEIGGGAKCYTTGSLSAGTLHLEAGAASEIDFTLEADSVSVRVSKNGFVRLAGKTRAVALKTSTGGSYEAETMDCNIIYADMKAGVARVKAEQIVANIAEKATIFYIDNPKIVEKEGSKGEIARDQE